MSIGRYKFRIYDEQAEEMCYFNLEQIDQGYLLPYGNTIKDFSKVMQYTGHEDKYDNEIYEGDIVEVLYYEPDSEKTLTIISKIVWKHDAFWVKSLKPVDYCYNGFLGHWSGRALKVIGNVIEHPELDKEVL